MAGQTPPTSRNYELAWVELGGYMRFAAEAGRQLDAASLLDYMQELHERFGLLPEHAPTREI